METRVQIVADLHLCMGVYCMKLKACFYLQWFNVVSDSSCYDHVKDSRVFA